VIVVVGAAAYAPSPGGIGRAVGPAPGIAAAAAAAGSAVEIVAKIGEDGAGEELLLALARAGVDHRAILRDPARPTSLALPRADALEDEEEPAIPALLAEAETAVGRPPGGNDPGVPPGLLLEAADLSLGLRYIRDYSVVVAVEPLAEGGPAVVAEAAAFADAALVVVALPGAAVPPAFARATVFEAPDEDPDGAFAGVVGRYAAALDQGIAPSDAFRAATGESGWQPAAG